MQAKLTCDCSCKPTAAFPDGIKPKGTLIDHPDVYRLVQIGKATAIDDECRERLRRVWDSQVTRQPNRAKPEV